MKIFDKIKLTKGKPKLVNPEHLLFHMSFRFNKTKPEDFGLIETEQENIFIDLKDNTKWEKRYLIDLGWGLEVAYCKLPYPSFNELLQLSFYSNSKEKSANYYCSIGLLLNDYPYELIEFTEKILSDEKNSLHSHKDFYHLVRTQMNYDDKNLNNKWESIFKQSKELI